MYLYKVRNLFSATYVTTTADVCIAFQVTKDVDALYLWGLGSHWMPLQGMVVRFSKSKYRVTHI